MASSQLIAMNCDICYRPHHPSRLPFLCAVDARNACYEGRVQTLQIMLQNEELQHRIGGLVTPTHIRAHGQPAGTPAEPLAKAGAVEHMASQRAFSEDRTNQILARAEKLRLDIATARHKIETLSGINARRRSDLTAASTGIDGRRERALDGVEGSIHTVRNHWNRSSDRTAATRGFLCMEAAKLYGLRRVKRGSSRYEYKLGGIDVIDLASMNSMPCPCRVHRSVGQLLPSLL